MHLSASIRTFLTRPLGRVFLFAALLFCEYAAIAAFPHPWLRPYQIMRVVIVFFAVFLVAIWPRLRQSTRQLPLSPVFLLPYSLCLLAILVAYRFLSRTSVWPVSVVGVWLAGILLSALFLLLALLPLRPLKALLRDSRSALAIAGDAALLAIAFLQLAELLWNSPSTHIVGSLQRSTFLVVAALLRVFYAGTVASPDTYTVTLPHFEVTIATACSGVEGLTMMLLFSAGWLWYSRKSLRFPQALLLVPCSLALIWVFNIARLIALLLIGNGGHPAVAENGFHSEAGWIAFNMVALGILLASTRINWFLKRSGDTALSHAVDVPGDGANAVAAYLAPFLAILAAGFFSKAVSSGFEWAYPLRLFAAGIMLWLCRRQLRGKSLACSVRSVFLGLLICAVWIGWNKLFPAPEQSLLGNHLQQLSAPTRFLWIAARTFAAVVTVPLAEELAFRGYLMRRIVNTDFQAVPYRRVPLYALAVSSVAFGAMHGRFWIPGILAGAAYAWIIRRSGRLGEGVWAHAISNAGIAAWVLLFHDWTLW